MAGKADGAGAWIFVSHASADLLQVRKVRNYLEDRGASPLLFHLRSLRKPEQFWPIIEREIAERNFFLFCESEAANCSSWVQRERDLVARISLIKKIRIGTITVEQESIDYQYLDSFVATIRVFPSYSSEDSARVSPYIMALKDAGFHVSDRSREEYSETLLQDIRRDLWITSQDGWHILFVTDRAISAAAAVEWGMSTGLGSGLVIVRLGDAAVPDFMKSHHWLDFRPETYLTPADFADQLIVLRK